ncbi:hypothetical protein A3196_04965 [Candidatus Thiodiazotropha endoloripes]|uniref:Uncharacterized protein n=1 Tax=Candidatus Thiodiazotropha endoloripes TaxID=1818881 RepID=A0A1E2UN49_9GAMM|nr:hypothetical protein A3196_04965 [Candidatus Thiodiazotropha endoloripes]
MICLMVYWAACCLGSISTMATTMTIDVITIPVIVTVTVMDTVIVTGISMAIVTVIVIVTTMTGVDVTGTARISRLDSFRPSAGDFS